MKSFRGRQIPFFLNAPLLATPFGMWFITLGMPPSRVPLCLFQYMPLNRSPMSFYSTKRTFSPPLPELSLLSFPHEKDRQRASIRLTFAGWNPAPIFLDYQLPPTWPTERRPPGGTAVPPDLVFSIKLWLGRARSLISVGPAAPAKWGWPSGYCNGVAGRSLFPIFRPVFFFSAWGPGTRSPLNVLLQHPSAFLHWNPNLGSLLKGR